MPLSLSRRRVVALGRRGYYVRVLTYDYDILYLHKSCQSVSSMQYPIIVFTFFITFFYGSLGAYTHMDNYVSAINGFAIFRSAIDGTHLYWCAVPIHGHTDAIRTEHLWVRSISHGILQTRT